MDGGGETVHAPFGWEGRERGGGGGGGVGADGGSDRDWNSRTITAKDKCIIRYSSFIFMNFSVPDDARRLQAAPPWWRAADTELLQSQKYATGAAFWSYTYFAPTTSTPLFT